MEFSIAALLANFTEDKLVAPKALEKKLDCNDATSQLKLQIALEALEKIGILVKDKGRYRQYLAAIPTHVITTPLPAFRGLRYLLGYR